MMKFAYKLLSCLPTILVSIGLLMTATAHAQWGWTDKDGRRIFSDQAPTAEVPDKSIFKRPGGAKAVAAAQAKSDAAAAAPAPAASGAVATASAPAGAASGLKVSGKDSELEKKKKEAEDFEKAKKKAEEEKVAAAKADNCKRVQASLINFNSGIRMTRVDGKGEREFMNDTDRAAEVKRLQEIAKADCK